MTALATSPKFEGACGLQFTAESGPLFIDKRPRASGSVGCHQNAKAF